MTKWVPWIFIAALGIAIAAYAGDGGEGDFELSIALPGIGYQPNEKARRFVPYDGPESHFHVLVRNVADSARRLWPEGFSEGYRCLWFTFDDHDRKWQVRKNGIAFWGGENVPRYYVLEPGETLTLDVFPGSKEWAAYTVTPEGTNLWRSGAHGFPIPEPGQVRTLKTKAFFSIRSSREAKEYGVWTGTVSSVEYECVFGNSSEETPGRNDGPNTNAPTAHPSGNMTRQAPK